MSAVASSRINKSGKKFVPKAPVRRAAPGPTKPVASEPTPVETESTQTPLSPPPAESQPANVVVSQSSQPESAETLPSSLESLPTSPVLRTVDSPPQKENGSIAIPIPTPVAIPAPRIIQAPSQPIPRPVPSPRGVPIVITPASRSSKPDKSKETLLIPQPQAPSPPNKRKRGAAASDGATKEVVDKRRKTSTPIEDGQDKSEITAVSTPATRTRSTRAKKATGGDGQDPEGEDATGSGRKTRKPPAKPRKRQPKKSPTDGDADTTGETSEQIGEDGKAKRKRQLTPDDAESHEITTSTVTMADLTRDTRLGRKSEREIRLQNTDWNEVKRKRKLLEEARLAGPPKEQAADNAPAPVPQMVIINGQVTTVEGSQYVDANGLDIDDSAAAPAAINEDDIVNRINSGTLGRKKNHLGRNRWDEEMTSLFYRGLRMFGTDFMMISQMFPGLTRRHVKSKFVKEERNNPELIKQTLLGPREEANLAEISQMNNIVYNELEDFEKQLDAVRKEEEANHAKAEAEKAKHADASTAHGDGDTEVDGDGQFSSKENRFNGIADSIISAATSGGRKNRRQRMMAKKNMAKNPSFAGGEARILGPVNEA